MSSFSIDFNAATATVESMASINSQIKGGLSELEANCNASLATWEGSAQEAYHHAKTVWNNAADQMTVSLGQAQSALNEIIAAYTDGEVKSAGLWRQ